MWIPRYCSISFLFIFNDHPVFCTQYKFDWWTKFSLTSSLHSIRTVWFLRLGDQKSLYYIVHPLTPYPSYASKGYALIWCATSLANLVSLRPHQMPFAQGHVIHIVFLHLHISHFWIQSWNHGICGASMLIFVTNKVHLIIWHIQINFRNIPFQ